MPTRRMLLGGFVAALLRPTTAGLAATLEMPPPRQEHLIRDRAQLERRLAEARPGDHLLLEPGAYGSAPIPLTCRGTPEAPVVVRALEPLAVRLPGFDFAASSSDILVWGIDLRESESHLRGVRNILRRCAFRPPYRRAGSSVAIHCSHGRDCRIDYCDIRLYSENETGGWEKGAVQAGIRGSFKASENNAMISLTIERCDFSGGPKRNVYNTPYGNFCTTAPNVTESEIETYWKLRYCRVRNAPTNFTIFEAKSSKNLFEFLDVVSDSGRGYISWRQGHDNLLRASRLHCHVRISRGPNNAAHALYLGAGFAIQVMAGKTRWDVYTNDNPQAFRAHIAGIQGEGRIVVGETFGEASRRFPALATQIEGVTVPLDYGLHEGTIVREEIADAVVLDPPVQLSDRDVGVFALWQG